MNASDKKEVTNIGVASSSVSSDPSVSSSLAVLPSSESTLAYKTTDLGLFTQSMVNIKYQLEVIRKLMITEAEKMLDLREDEIYDASLFKKHTKELSRSLESLDNYELDGVSKKTIQSTLESFPLSFNDYIREYLDDDFEVRSTWLKFKFRIDDRLSSYQAHVEYLASQLQAIITLLKSAKESTLKINPSPQYRFYFQEIDETLKKIKVAGGVKGYKVEINKRIESILVLVQEDEEFFSDAYNMSVLNKLSASFMMAREGKNKSNIARKGSFGGILNSLPDSQDSQKVQETPVVENSIPTTSTTDEVKKPKLYRIPTPYPSREENSTKISAKAIEDELGSSGSSCRIS